MGYKASRHITILFSVDEYVLTDRHINISSHPKHTGTLLKTFKDGTVTQTALEVEHRPGGNPPLLAQTNLQ